MIELVMVSYAEETLFYLLDCDGKGHDVVDLFHASYNLYNKITRHTDALLPGDE